MNIDISSWDKRNVGALPSGELVVREVLEAPTTVFSTSTALKAWTIKCQSTDTVWHYIIGSSTSSGIFVQVIDENFVTIQIFLYNSFDLPKDISLSVVEDQLMITSPDLPSVWGVVGSGLIYATSQTSANTFTTVLENIPQGISVSWAGRCVIATRETIFFSDALYPRTYVGFNSVDPPGGSIYGLHVNSGGALIVCTTTGVYALPEDAAASGQLVVGVFSKLTDYECVNYKTTCSCKGRVYGLTKRGYRLIDTTGSEEVILDESVLSVPLLTGASAGRIHVNDYRDCEIFQGHDGVYVYFANKYLHYTDFTAKMKTWWHSSDGIFVNFGGTGFENDGTEILFLRNPSFRNGNNSAIEGVTFALVMGRMELPSDLSPVIRHVTFASDSYRPFKFFIRGDMKSLIPKTFAPVVNTDTWEDATANEYQEPRIQSRQSDWSLRGDDLTFVLGVEDHPSRIPTSMDVVFKGPGKKRPT